MSNWDDIGKEAAEQTDKELAAGLDNLKNKNMAGLSRTPLTRIK